MNPSAQSHTVSSGVVRSVAGETMVRQMSEVTAASAAMHERDDVAQGLGIVIDGAELGAATASMTVTDAMTNGWAPVMAASSSRSPTR